MPTFGGLGFGGGSKMPLPTSITGSNKSTTVYDLNGVRYMAIQFFGSGSITMPIQSSARVLVVGGGAGGSGNGGAWGPTGGNGGVQEVNVTLAAGATYSIGVGGGGGAGDYGGAGGNSSISGTGVSVVSTGGSGGYPNGPAAANGTPTNNGYTSSIIGTNQTYSSGAFSSNYGSGGVGFSADHYYKANGVQGTVVVRVQI